MNKSRVAIQGGPASFHDAAARQLLPGMPLEVAHRDTFSSLCVALQQGETDAAVMAIENTLAGSLLPNYALLQEHRLHITAELWLPIDQNLMALPGQRIAELRTVASHPVALAQCKGFLQQHPHLQPQVTHDTADSAKAIQEQGLRATAAIAGRAAAELYGLEILAENIADSPQNHTRFLLLREQPEEPADADKAIVVFRKPIHTSTLTLLLSLLQKHQVELTLLQTLPAGEGRAQLVAEVEAPHVSHLQQAISQVRPLVEDLQVLGILKQAVRPDTSTITKETAAIL
ncbi:prephenate dehydratase domain-containing protein [Pontibacter chinhatensis]|uniref:prephenate dehydratase n=1 Tax=Pontibacter chinhatensis TaxID=1436961 RepID=A0A1I2Y0K1_9BACT|nr:prephenate dehydratase domain-containing protein [Pontibacter chinhatensis]SFH19270.1 prephenate dehydratase [Pontibacter chinhatensis]